jgi:hypothetical protein
MIVVRNGRLGRGVYAAQELTPGQVVLRGWGYRIPRRTRHSIQVDLDTHVRFPSAIELINHSCEPNCGMFHRRGSEVLEVHTLAPTQPGEELTIDYATFEYEIEFMTGPCCCGTSLCRGRITGFKDLPLERRIAYGPYIAEYLQELEASVSRAG